MGYRDVTDEQVLDAASRISRRWWRSSDGVEFDDLYQDVCLALVKARDRYDPRRGSWPTYADAVGVGAVKDHFREQPIGGKQWLRGSSDGERAGEIIYLNHFETQDAFERASGSRRDVHENLQIEDVLRATSNPRRKFIALCLIAGYNRSEISSMLGVSPSIVSLAIAHLVRENLKFCRDHPKG